MDLLYKTDTYADTDRTENMQHQNSLYYVVQICVDAIVYTKYDKKLSYRREIALQPV